MRLQTKNIVSNTHLACRPSFYVLVGACVALTVTALLTLLKGFYQESGSSIALRDTSPPEPNVTIAGYLDSVFGVAESARRVADVVAAAGFGVGTFSFHSAHHWTATSAPTHPRVNASGQLNIINVNAAEVQGALDMAPHIFRPRPGFTPLNVAVWYWELETFPVDKLGDCTRDVAAVWVATEFVRQAIASAVSVPVVKVVLPPPHMPASTFDWRAKLSVGASTTLFLFNFDYLSHVRRKNPDAVVAAFKLAFTDMDDAALVIKSVHSTSSPDHAAHWQALQQSLRTNTFFIDDNLSAHDLGALYAAADCFVSLHRSEGLGLGMLTAMSLGKPVIATNYSGNVDFTKDDNSFLVDYQRVPIGKTDGPYEGHQFWANPNVTTAARHMRTVHANSTEAIMRGRMAAAYIKRLYSTEHAAKVMQRAVAETIAAQKRRTFTKKYVA